MLASLHSIKAGQTIYNSLVRTTQHSQPGLLHRQARGRPGRERNASRAGHRHAAAWNGWNCSFRYPKSLFLALSFSCRRKPPVSEGSQRGEGVRGDAAPRSAPAPPEEGGTPRRPERRELPKYPLTESHFLINLVEKGKESACSFRGGRTSAPWRETLTARLWKPRAASPGPPRPHQPGAGGRPAGQTSGSPEGAGDV